MNNKSNRNTEEVLDLQIFLTRSPGYQPFRDEGLPSFVIAGEGREPTARYRETVPSKQSKENSFYIEAGYIAIANSSVVEEVAFPFSAKVVLEMVNKLESNKAKLVECMEFGIKLFDFAIHGSIRDLFRELSNQGKILRLTISTSIPELAMLPWELMCDNKSGSFPQFLCFHPKLRFCRALHLFNRQEFIPKKPLGDDDIRILFVTANPTTQYLDFSTEARLLDFVLHESPVLSDVKLDILSNASSNSLRERLLSFHPHILHLSCHGGYNREENFGFVTLASYKNPKQPDYVNSYRLASIIQEAKDSIQIAVISTCYGAFGGDNSTFSGVAQLLHAGGINDVIALNFQVMDSTSHAILANFYKYLLRHGFTVEESISQIRRFLFINGYRVPESFGLTLYQSNASLCRVEIEDPSLRYAADSKEFDKTLEKLEESLVRPSYLDSKISELLDLGDLKDLTKGLSSVDIILAYKIFNNINIGIKLIKEIVSSNVDKDLFLKLTEVARILSQRRNERKSISTSLILKTDDSENSYFEKYKNNIVQFLGENFFDSDIKTLIEKALNVNGEDKTFVVLITDKKKKLYKAFVQDLGSLDSEAIQYIDDFGYTRWNRVQFLIRESGCALILPGDSRVKILAKGEQLAEFRDGEWRFMDFKYYKLKINELAQLSSFDENVLLNAFQKCIAASELTRGLTLVIQLDGQGVLERCHPGYIEDLLDLKEKTIMDCGNKEYLDRIAGDNAVILDRNGHTLAIKAAFAPQASTHVIPIPGTGTRHLSAQKMTKETKAIAFVVSEDGPITVFFQGETVFRVL
ncbi:CHAT domain-containing protein [Nostoc linckia FACHB-104]|nr:CHAT domain-containing protein [Nostoc linckia FACHB-104]